MNYANLKTVNSYMLMKQVIKITARDFGLGASELNSLFFLELKKIEVQRY